MTKLGHKLRVATTSKLRDRILSFCYILCIVQGWCPGNLISFRNCKKTLVDIAVLLMKKRKGQPKSDCKKKRGFSDLVLPFAKLCRVIWSLSGKQIQIIKGHRLRQGWPISNYWRTTKSLRTPPRPALVYKLMGKKGWFTGFCLKSDDSWFQNIISVGRVAQSV